MAWRGTRKAYRRGAVPAEDRQQRELCVARCVHTHWLGGLRMCVRAHSVLLPAAGEK